MCVEHVDTPVKGDILPGSSYLPSKQQPTGLRIFAIPLRCWVRYHSRCRSSALRIVSRPAKSVRPLVEPPELRDLPSNFRPETAVRVPLKVTSFPLRGGVHQAPAGQVRCSGPVRAKPPSVSPDKRPLPTIVWPVYSSVHLSVYLSAA